MHILQLTSKPPFPEIDGGCKAMAALTKGLANNGHTVTLISIATQKHPFNLSAFPKNSKINAKSVTINTAPSFFKALYCLIINKSYNIFRFNNPKVHELVRQTLHKNNIDAIILDSLYVTTYINTIRNYSNCPIIYREHNIEYKLWTEKSLKEKNIFKKNYFNILTKQLKKIEENIFNQVDGIVCISPEDAIFIKSIAPAKKITFIPYSIDIPKHSKITFSKKMFFIGSFEWEPNVNGLKWFIDNVWGKLLHYDSEIELHLAGKGMNKDKWVGKNIFSYGEVSNADEFIEPFTIMPVPLFQGSGVRIKIIEAMAKGKVIIATSKAAEGILFSDRKNILIANNTEEFISQITYCITNSEKTKIISEEAIKNAQLQFNTEIVIGNLISFIQSIKKNG